MSVFFEIIYLLPVRAFFNLHNLSHKEGFTVVIGLLFFAISSTNSPATCTFKTLTLHLFNSCKTETCPLFLDRTRFFWYLSNMDSNRLFRKYVLNSAGLVFKYPKENTYVPVESKLSEQLFWNGIMISAFLSFAERNWQIIYYSSCLWKKCHEISPLILI